MRKGIFIAIVFTSSLEAQQAVKLTLADAEAMALKNHPQVQAAQHEQSASESAKSIRRGRPTIRTLMATY